MYKMRALAAIAIMAAGFNCTAQNKPATNDVQKYLDAYTKTYVKLYTQEQEAQWRSNIEILAKDSSNVIAARKADEAMASFTGSIENIEKSRAYLKRTTLTPLQKKQLEFILYTAANNPQTIPAVVKERIKAENEQTQTMYGFHYHLDGKDVSVNDIDNMLKTEKDVNRRFHIWEVSKHVGIPLKKGLINLRNLRNQSVQALGYSDFFSYQVSDYGMTTDEMLALNDQLMRDLYPLYRELHTWIRYVLAATYDQQQVPDYIPAHWLPNRWGQDWSSVLDVPGMDLDGALKHKSAQWIVKDAEQMYVSLGFDPLPATFWKKSSLYPYPDDSAVKKNNHASAWHMDLNKDVRSLMSVEPNAEWYETAHHELGHIYYYMTYSNPSVPPLLRQGANRAYHEALGTMMGLAAMQRPFVYGRGLIKPDPKAAEIDSILPLLKEALNTVVFIYFSSGVMTHFEKEMYADTLPADQFNKRWWELVKKYQGIVPQGERGENLCDAATKTHINDDPAQYYDYALSYEILYQLHNHIAKKILHQSPHATNYYGHKEVGDFLKKIMYPGASKDWRQVLKQSTGDELNGKAMVEYFQPLYKWLQQNNATRNYTLPEHMDD